MKFCPKCKQTKKLDDFHNHKGTTDGKQYHCKECLKTYSQTYPSKQAQAKYQSRTWRGIANNIKGHMKHNSLRRGHHWDDSWWSVETILENIQNKSCSVTGIPFDLKHEDQKYKRRAFVPSPDRIDNSRGYEPDNVRWVSAIYNMMKNNFDDVDVAHFLQTLKNL